MIIDTKGFDGHTIWIPSLTDYNVMVPRCYGECIDDDGFALKVLLDGTDSMVEWVCRSNCYKSRKECQLFCDRLNGVNHD